MLLKNQWVNEEIKKKIKKKIPQDNDHEDTITQNPWDATKQCSEGSS